VAQNKKPAVTGGFAWFETKFRSFVLRADACRAVQGTVMMAGMDVVDKRHDRPSLVDHVPGWQATSVSAVTAIVWLFR
jgi:hypothetical protein